MRVLGETCSGAQHGQEDIVVDLGAGRQVLFFGFLGDFPHLTRLKGVPWGRYHRASLLGPSHS